MVTSDRISAFDVVMAEPIPDKGRVLTAMSAFWFDQLADVAPSHLISTDLADLPDDLRGDDLEGRVMLCRKAEMLPIECIVRGYLTGLGVEGVQGLGHHARHLAARGPAGVGPAPRAGVHAVDQGRGRRPRREHLASRPPSTSSARSWPRRARDVSLELYRRGAAWAAERGILIADTKFELGWSTDSSTVCDEVLTPDSSRFWPADEW